jgi:S-adenosylmethionine:tRNA ribosyltransferase-isomerase
MKLEDFDYPLNKELIAQVPLNKRDDSRLMVVDRVKNDVSIKKFKGILNHINKGDILVINDTRVFPARIFGKKNTGGKVELLLVKKLSGDDKSEITFSALTKSSKPVKVGQRITFSDELSSEVVEVQGDGKAVFKFHAKRDIFSILNDIGVMPLPPYIKREGSERAAYDKEHYQTVYAKNIGAIAAPTAGLHFTEDILDALLTSGVKIVNVTLHVGLGTFLPIRAENILDHEMHEEYFNLSEECIKEVTKAKKNGNKIIAVGTTSMRALESAFDEEKGLKRKEGNTSLFIYPGYKFKIVDALITNFHLPKSTLLMLVSAFGGVELIRRAYDMAIKESFRFYSYGDAMLIA